MVLPPKPGTGPKLRAPLEFIPVDDANQRFVLLRDPLEVATEVFIVPVECVPVLILLDGDHSVEQIARDKTCASLTIETVTELVKRLKDVGFLETSEAREKLAENERKFLELTTRPAELAGFVYPKDGVELQSAVEEIIASAERRLNIPHSKRIYPVAEEGLVPSTQSRANVPIRALICPHIDYRRGWQGYGAAYSALAHAETPDVIFLIGTSHYGGKSLFQLSKMHFESPLGVLRSARKVVEQLSSAYGYERSFQDEFLHKREHSLELQLPFLSYRFGTGPSAPEIVPILVGSFHQALIDRRPPREFPEVQDFIAALAECIRTLRAEGRKVLLYGGVDLSHMGRYFGDTKIVHENGLDEIEHRDQLFLETILNSDHHALYEHMAEDADRRRVCGFPSIYTMLAALRDCDIALDGHLIDYRQAVNPANDCIVTFASAAWTEVGS